MNDKNYMDKSTYYHSNESTFNVWTRFKDKLVIVGQYDKKYHTQSDIRYIVKSFEEVSSLYEKLCEIFENDSQYEKGSTFEYVVTL